MKKNICKLFFDMAMAFIFVMLFKPTLTGLGFHEIVSLVLGCAVLIHLFLNRKWIEGITKKLFSKRIPKRTKFLYLFNLLFLIDMVLILWSGLCISRVVTPELKYHTTINWLPIHIASTFFGIALIGIHVGLHWDWLKQIGKRFAFLKKICSFRKIAMIILVVGTIAFVVQLPGQIVNTGKIITGSSQHHEEGVDRQRSVQANSNFKRGREHGFESRGHQSLLSISGLVANIPVTIFYGSMAGAIAYYAYRVDKKRKGKKKQTKENDKKTA